jgi:hypothetical protein
MEDPGPDRLHRNAASDRKSLERQSFIATIRSYLLNRWALAVAAVALAASVVIGLESIASDGEGGQRAGATGTGNTINQNQVTDSVCGLVGDNSSCVVQLERSVESLSEMAATDDELKAALARQATGSPSGDGPWPFIVVDTGTQGLFARTTNEVRADRVGVAANRSIVWADCVATSGFTPAQPRHDFGPKWLRVRWKSNQPTQAFLQSDPSDPKRAWMYLGYTMPYKHDGQIPPCP